MSLSVLSEDRTALRFDRPVDEAQGFGLKDLYRILRRRLPLIAAIVLGGTFLSLVASIEIPKVYTARSTILLKPDDPNLLDGAPSSLAPQPNASRMDTETDLMTSRVFAGRVVDELNLIADPRFNTFLSGRVEDEASEPPGLVQRARALVGEGLAFVGISQPETEDELPAAAIQRDRAVTAFLSRMQITRSGESNAMTVAVSDDDPKMAATIANAVTELYAEWSRDLKQDSTRDAVQFLRQQASELAIRISTLESEIADYGRRENVSSDPRDDLLRATMQQANEQLGIARGDLAQARSLLDQARQTVPEGTTSPLPASDFLTTLRGEEAAALGQRAEIGRNFGANHPLIQEADAKIASVRSLISEERGRIVARIEADQRVAERRVDGIEDELAVSQQELRRRADAEIRLRELNRDLLTEQQLYDVVSARLGKLDPYAEIAKPNARVISLAAIPTEPSFPQTHALVAGGFVGSLLLAFVAAIGLETLDTRIRSAKRAAQLLRAPVLALIPRRARRLLGRQEDLLAQAKGLSRSAVAEGFRGVYGACKRARMSRQGQVVLVTSGLPLEGKTSVAVGLALAAASQGVRTMLVDLDLHTSGLGRSVRSTANTGTLNDYLDGRCALRDIVEAVPGLASLSVVRSSAVTTSTQTILHSGRLEELIDTFRSEYDIVIVDSPPLLIVEDAAAIAPLVDAVILVAAWGRTSEETLSEAGERLRQSGGPIIGIVLNGFDEGPHGRGLMRGSGVRRRQIDRYFTRLR